MSSIKVFCSYAHKDQAFLNDLKTYLKPLQRQGVISIWSDTDISAGSDWEEEIEEHLDAAHVILLLISPDFMASEYCYSKEMRQTIRRHQRGEVRVIPIILRVTDWHIEYTGPIHSDNEKDLCKIQ